MKKKIEKLAELIYLANKYNMKQEVRLGSHKIATLPSFLQQIVKLSDEIGIDILLLERDLKPENTIKKSFAKIIRNDIAKNGYNYFIGVWDFQTSFDTYWGASLIEKLESTCLWYKAESVDIKQVKERL